uniref:Uncharacterized protein n=1 Tax=viral metagenome TaxID=1070528 RepID=A0A6C0K8Q8_9ZZZZ
MSLMMHSIQMGTALNARTTLCAELYYQIGGMSVKNNIYAQTAT